MNRSGVLVARIVEVDFRTGIVKLEARVTPDVIGLHGSLRQRDPLALRAADAMLETAFELELPPKGA